MTINLWDALASLLSTVFNVIGILIRVSLILPVLMLICFAAYFLF